MDKTATKKEDLSISYYIVAFVDILGQGEKLGQIKHFPTNDDEQKRFNELWKNTYGVVRTFYEAFEMIFEAAKAYESKRIPEEYARRIRKSKVKRQTFSDAILIYAPLAEDENRDIISDVFGILRACIGAYRLFLSQKIALRAGIDIGLGIEDEYGLYGPAIANAYKLENKIAGFPRIVVGTQMLEYLVDVENSIHVDPIVAGYTKETVATCKNLIAVDGKGINFLDSLGSETKKIRSGDESKNVLDAYDFILQQIDVWERNGDEKLVKRYTELKEYFDSNIDRWLK